MRSVDLCEIDAACRRYADISLVSLLIDCNVLLLRLLILCHQDIGSLCSFEVDGSQVRKAHGRCEFLNLVVYFQLVAIVKLHATRSELVIYIACKQSKRE